MSIDTKSQVRAYADFLDSTLPVLEARDAMVELIGDPPVQPVQERPVRRVRLRSQPLTLVPRRRGMRVALAAVMVGLLFAGAIWLTRDDGDRDVIEQPTDTSTFPSSLTWSRVPHDEVVLGDKVPFTSGMRDIAVGGPGLVAVGEGDDGVTVWTSVDGFTWSRVPDQDAFFGGVQLASVTAGGPGLVAVGDWRDEDTGVWTSVDGFTWSRVPHDDAVFGRAGMESVTAGGPGLVAVGSAASGEGLDAAVWTSVDGIVWSRVPHDETVFGGQHDQQMNSVTVGGPGLVAVGSDGFLAVDRGQLGDYDDFTQVAAVWTSVDGITWSRVPSDEAVFGGDGNQWMNEVTSAASGLVAVGGDWSSAAHSAAVWTSVDGITWSRVPHDQTVFGGEHDQLMLSVTSTGSGLVAVGQAWQRSGGDDSAASVWTSDDGFTWSWVGYSEAVFGSEDNTSFLLSDGPVFTEYRQYMTSVTATDSAVVAVGADWSGPSHGAAVWVGVDED